MEAAQSETIQESNEQQPTPLTGTQKILMLKLGDHHFGITITSIQDVIHRLPLTHVELTAPYVMGVMNLRGQIFTEINVASLLGLNEEEINLEDSQGYSVIITRHGERYSFVFQELGDVMDVSAKDIEKLPTTVDESWLTVSKGVYRMDEKLVVILDVDLLLDYLMAQNEQE